MTVAPMGAATRMAKKTPGEELNYPQCVEHGIWSPVRNGPPEGPLILKLKDVDAKLSSDIKDAEVMSFHVTGCTGHYGNHQPGRAVARAMASQIADPRSGGGSETTKPAAFFFHLGDIIYKDTDSSNPERADMQKLFNEQFYETYAGYPQEIFAVPGNHDSKIKDKEGKSAIDHFIANFCAPDRHIASDNLSSQRKTMIQPYPYWVFRTPLAFFVCLYANDVNGGQLDDPAPHRAQTRS